MPRKPTGKPRGRPPVYEDDQLCIEVWRRVLSGRAKGAWAASEQLENERPDGVHRAPRSLAKRLYDKAVGARKRWFQAQARIRPVVRRRRRGGLADFVDSMRETQRFVEQHQRFADAVNQMIEHHRHLNGWRGGSTGTFKSETRDIYVGSSAI
jgi:hypothetical protein